jgi:hypothetical protein
VVRYSHELGEHRSSKIAWYEERKSATSNVRYSVRKISSMPKATGRHTRPMGYVALPGTTP